MKKVSIAHLYYDLMNLYGENGNIRFLKKRLEDQGIEVSVHFLSIDDKIDYSKYDFYYVGTGSEENKLIVLNEMLKDKNNIKKAVEDKKYFLVTGNALDLFGKRINYANDSIDGLNVFDYEINIEDFRIVGEQVYQSKLFKEKVIGFQNRNSMLMNASKPLFIVEKGNGNKPNDNEEGIWEKNFFGTYLLGPILVRNPQVTDYFVKELCQLYNIKYKKPNKEEVYYKAYDEYLKNFHLD